MCGKYSIYEAMDVYLWQLALDLVLINGYDHKRINRYSVAPSKRVELIRQNAAGLRVDRVKWGWAPFWAKGKRPDPINARAETVMTGKFFKALWSAGRALAPANGWFEWIPQPIRSGNSSITLRLQTISRCSSQHWLKCMKGSSPTTATGL